MIGGAPAAAVVLTRDVRTRLAADEEMRAARRALDAAGDDVDADRRLRLIEELDTVRVAAGARARASVAAEFDAVHTVDRAVRVGSLDSVIAAKDLRPRIVEVLNGE